MHLTVDHSSVTWVRELLPGPVVAGLHVLQLWIFCISDYLSSFLLYGYE